MHEIMMAQSHIGIVHFGTNEVFFSRSPLNSAQLAQKFQICKSPTSSIGSKCMFVRKSLAFDGRKTQFCRVAPLPVVYFTRKPSFLNAAQSSGVEIIENDLEFSPTFHEYLKVMESLKTGRSENVKLIEKFDVVVPKKRIMEKRGQNRVKDNSGSGKIIIDKDSSRKKSYNHKNERDKVNTRVRTSRLDEDKYNGNSYRKTNIMKQTKDEMYHIKDELLNDKEVKRKSDEFETLQGGTIIGSKNEHKFNHSKHILKSGCSEILNVTKHDENTFKRVYVRKAMDEIETNYGEAKEYYLNDVEKSNYNDVNNMPNGKTLIRKKERDKLNTRVRTSRLNEDKYDGNGYKISNIMTQTNDEMNRIEDEQFNDKEVKRKKVEFETLQKKTIIECKNERKFNDSKQRLKSGSCDIINVAKHDENTFKRVYVGKAMDGVEMNCGEAKEYCIYDVERSNVHDVNNRGNGKTLIRKNTDNYVRVLDYIKPKEEDKYKTIDVKGRTATHDNHLLKFGVKEDRAAFKSFEVFTDVRNRPRVLRMELEDKLQKLAKWLNATDINMPEWQFSKIIHGAKIKFTEHSILRIVQILGGLGNWRRALQVVQWLQSRERFKTYKSRYIYTSVLDVLGKAKRPVEALNIFYAMREEFSSYPDLAAYHCIAVTLGQAGLMNELFDVIDCMRALPEKKFNLGPLQKWDPRLEPDLVVYNAVLNACVQQKKWEGAFWVLQQLKQHNIQPTNTTLGLIMEVMLECEKYSLVHEFFRQVEQSSIPSSLNYKVLVNTLWRERKADEAVLAVTDMERRGVVGSASLYYDLARCLCSAGRCKEALLQIDKICKVAKKPLVVTYTGLIQACLDSGNIEDGKYIFNEMHKYCSPNTITCNIMLKSYIHHRMYDDAFDLFQKILDGSHQIRNKYDADQKSNPDKFTFNTMMDACAATKNWDDFENTYEQMLNHGYHFDTRRHLRLVMDAFRAGKRRIIETTWNHLTSFGRDPPPLIIQERFCIKLEENDCLAALLCIKVYNGKEMHAFSEKSWLYLLKNNAHRFKTHSLLRLSHELYQMIEETDTPCLMYRNLLNACKELAKTMKDI